VVQGPCRHGEGVGEGGKEEDEDFISDCPAQRSELGGIIVAPLLVINARVRGRDAGLLGSGLAGDDVFDLSFDERTEELTYPTVDTALA